MEGVRILANDSFFMRRALHLAERARGMTSPNPMVGAVVVKNGRIIAEGYHAGPGELHAEALALLHSEKRSEKATLYVSLEPCCHIDKRTPPCTRAILRSGVKRVVVAMKDPNPKVSGRGIEELRSNGIEVIVGILEEKARKLNEIYIKYITTGIPFVTMKVAMTLDGKIATPEGQSKWITGEKARRLVHRMRRGVDSIMTAEGTVLVDDPELTVRLHRDKTEAARNPKRIVIAPRLEIPLEYKVFSVPPETLVVTRITEETKEKVQALVRKGVRILECEGERVDLQWLMKTLGGMGITSVMMEGGSSLNAYALQDGIVDKVAFFIAPKIIGGKESCPAIGGKIFRRLEEAYTLKDAGIRKIGDDFLIEGYLKRQ